MAIESDHLAACFKRRGRIDVASIVGDDAWNWRPATLISRSIHYTTESWHKFKHLSTLPTFRMCENGIWSAISERLFS